MIYSMNIDHFDHIKSEINFKNVFIFLYLLYYNLISKHNLLSRIVDIHILDF